MASINKSSLFNKAAVLLLAAGGATGLYVQQGNIDKQINNTTALEKRVDDLNSGHELALVRERALREAQVKEAIAQTHILQGELNHVQGVADQALAANDDLRNSLSEREQTEQDMQSTIDDLNRRLGSSIGMEQVTDIVNRAAPAAVNISYKNKAGDNILLSGSIVKLNGKRYLLTVGHGHENALHWLNQELTLKMFNGPTFHMRPRPLEDGSIPYLTSSTGDLALTELSPEVDAQLPNSVGLEIRSASEPPKYAEPILVVGNPDGLNSAISVGFVRHPGRYVVLGGKLYSNQAQVTELDGGNSGGPVISLRDGKLIAVSGWVRRGYMTHGFGASNVNIASLIDGTFRIPIMTPEDKSKVGIRKLAERFQLPTPICPIPLGNFVPVANESLEMPNVHVLEPLSRFIMPTPGNPLLLSELIPKNKK